MRHCIFLLPLAMAVVSCSTPARDIGYSQTEQVGNNLARYGVPGALGAGGGAVGYALSDGNPLVTAGGAAVGVGAGVLNNVYHDGKEEHAYQQGLVTGGQMKDVENFQNLWEQRAVENEPVFTGANGPRAAAGQGSTKRKVYVPSRTINGVTYPASYQILDVYD